PRLDAEPWPHAAGAGKLPLLVARRASMTGARQEILERIAAAVAGAPETDPPPRGYRRAGTLGAEERTALFCVRVGEYRAEVERIAEADVAAVVESVCSSRGVLTL